MRGRGQELLRYLNGNTSYAGRVFWFTFARSLTIVYEAVEWGYAIRKSHRMSHLYFSWTYHNVFAVEKSCTRMDREFVLSNHIPVRVIVLWSVIILNSSEIRNVDSLLTRCGSMHAVCLPR